MKVSSRHLPLALVALVFSMPVFQTQVSAQTARTTTTSRPRPTVKTNESASYRFPWEHGYRAGYEDGHLKGKSDFNDAGPRNPQNSEAYRRANRTYNERMGRLEEYQDAYQIGFELGYDDGYFGREYNAAIPPNLNKVVAADLAENAAAPIAPAAEAHPETRPQPPVYSRTDNPRSNVPERSERQDREARDTRAERVPARDRVLVRDGVQLKIRLQTPIDTKINATGDRFTAVVLDPSEYADAVITGHIAKLNKSGKMSGKTELALAFDSIQLRDGSSARFAAQVERVYESDSVKTIDEEGNVESGSRTTDTAVRTGGGAALGAIIGGIAGGGKGAAIGAAIGAGVGAGSVIYQGSKDVQLDPGTEMLIRSASPAQTRE
jgi:hypothetical protein